MKKPYNEEKVSFSYETLENSSYLVATLKDGLEPITYQMEMLNNNEIENILSSNKHQNNEDIQIYYNVTSRVSLAQAVSRKKMDKESFLNVLSGAVTAFREANEYQLVNTGILLDMDYIFVKTGSFEPSFVYLPVCTEDEGVSYLKEFIIGLILKGVIEVSNDNFVQVVLERMNSETLSLSEIEKMVIELKKTSPASGAKVASKPQANTNAVKPPYQEEVKPPPFAATAEEASVPPVNTPPTPQKPSVPNNSKPGGMNIPGQSGDGGKKDEASEKKKNENPKKKEGKSNPKKTIMIGLQVIFAAVLLKLVTSGALVNAETGGIDLKVVFAAVLVIGATNFILYRELFKNKEDGEQKPEKKAEKQAKEKFSLPFKKSKDQPKQESVQQSAPQAPQPVPPQPPQQPPVQNYTPPASGGMQIESDDTVVLTEDTEGSAYLEIFDNGLSTKVPLNKPSILVGRLRGSVDFVVDNNKVGKIHAEFISRGGSYYVKDYNSTNGTYINGSGQRINSNVECEIKNNDRITLANSEFILKC